MKNGGADVVHIRVAVVHGVSHLFRKSTSGGGRFAVRWGFSEWNFVKIT